MAGYPGSWRDNAGKATAVATGLLLVKHIATAYSQVLANYDAGRRPPEDRDLWMPFRSENVGPQDFEGTHNQDLKARERALRFNAIVRNDVENIPLGLIVAWASLYKARSYKGHIALVGTFVVARLLHTFFYVRKKQPHRILVFFMGLGSVLGMYANSIWGHFRGSR